MLLWNYYLCIVTDPGRVPDGWVRLTPLLFPSSDIWSGARLPCWRGLRSQEAYGRAQTLSELCKIQAPEITSL